MAEGIELKTSQWIITKEGYVGRVKSVEGDHVTITIVTAAGTEERTVGVTSIMKVGN